MTAHSEMVHPEVDPMELCSYLEQPQGYLIPEVSSLVNHYFWEWSEEKSRDPNFNKGRQTILAYVSKLLWDDLIPTTKNGDPYFVDSSEEQALVEKRLNGPIPRVVIHHSNTSGNTSLRELNAYGFLGNGLYLAYYSKNQQSLPFSGHYFQGRQVFFTYHWAIWPNGTAQRLLNNEDVAWHTGKWPKNLETVGIDLVGTFTKSRPTIRALLRVAQIMATHYSQAEIVGHGQITDTECPGVTFYDKGNVRGWNHVLR